MFSAMKAAAVLFSLCCQESRGSLWLDIFGWRRTQTQQLEMSSSHSARPARWKEANETELMEQGEVGRDTEERSDLQQHSPLLSSPAGLGFPF